MFVRPAFGKHCCWICANASWQPREAWPSLGTREEFRRPCSRTVDVSSASSSTVPVLLSPPPATKVQNLLGLQLAACFRDWRRDAARTRSRDGRATLGVGMAVARNSHQTH